jgi:DNA-binding NarL/FixJ family response regulator
VHPYDLYSLRLCLHHNVAACISNNAPACEILTAVQEVSSGDRYHCQMVQQAIRRYGINPRGRPLFCEKELQVLQYITQDKTTIQIAALLYSSPYTIDAIRKRMMAKAGTPNITALVCYALRRGYLRLDAL